MRKTNEKRLSLKTESVRHLTPENLTAVQGGGYNSCCSTAVSQRMTCSTQDTGCCYR
ncbi:MAG: hypothetical protein K8M05_38995 [Deltaproteobacteria bacterium]|nr:hypothetical protein [Kofleriaceae bacterium]